tara:strand:+ start:642 stop:1151 length:510 start_codon:yes stop_codon:yes gene_type:complete
MELFDEIRKNINAEMMLEFEKYNVKNIKIDSEIDYDINKISYDVNKFKSKIGKLQYLNQMKGKKIPNYDIGNDLMFGSINNETERCTWTNLSTKIRKNKLIEFLDTINLAKPMYEEIIKRRIYKKDVEYDIFTEKIKSLNFLNLVNDEYVVTKKIKKKKKQKMIFKIIK